MKLIIKVCICLFVLIGIISSRKINDSKKGTQHVNEKCDKDSDCVGEGY